MNSDDRICHLVQADPHGEAWDAAQRTHASECPDCAAHVEVVRELGRRVQALPSLPRSMPEAMRAGMLRLLDEGAPARPRLTLVPRRLQQTMVPLALAASLFIGLLVGHNYDITTLWGPNEVNRNIGMYINDVTHDHYLIERIGRPLEVAITDRNELSGWLSESLHFRLALPEPGPAFRLQGGRVWHTVGRLSALAAYEVPDGGRVLLFAVPAHNLELDGAESTMVSGRRVYTGKGWEREARVWIDGDLAMALVAMDGAMPADWAGSFLP
ncbi:MAG: hypothetical protein IPO18_00590 [bacterium]|nr:hypothetical protein [bacterium]MBK9470771.1 hypothetical protein [bacterium]